MEGKKKRKQKERNERSKGERKIEVK